MPSGRGSRTSAGLLVYRRLSGDRLEVLLVHPGGPFWARKDAGAWSIPKGEHGPQEDPLVTALREFREELGLAPPDGPALALGEVTQTAGKRVSAWALEWPSTRAFGSAAICSNEFEMEWPPRSGRQVQFPEIDRAEWFDAEVAMVKLNPAQCAFVDRLVGLLSP